MKEKKRKVPHVINEEQDQKLCRLLVHGDVQYKYCGVYDTVGPLGLFEFMTKLQCKSPKM